MDLADLVGSAGVVEDALGRRGLTRVDVRDDADVASVLEIGRHDVRPVSGAQCRVGLDARDGSLLAPTSDSGRRPCSPQPFDGRLRAA